MKKRTFSLIVLLIIIFSSLSISFAQDDLQINRWLIDAHLLENGDLEVSEDISFNFNSDFNGVYRNIVLEKIDSIENLTVLEIDKGAKIPYREVEEAREGDRNKFTLARDKKDLEIKIFSPSADEVKTFRLKYLLTNVATIHSDTGELYYKFLGEENKTYIDYLSVDLFLPSFEKDNINIFAHGPEQGKIYFSDGKIKMEISNIEPDEFIETRVLFPREYILSSNNLGNKDFSSILKEERVLAERLEKDKREREANESLFSKISIYLSSFIGLISLLVFYKFRRSKDVFENMTSIYPDDITPAELSLFMNKVISPRALLASLFNLSYKGYLEIESIENDRGKFKDQYIFTKKSKSREDLTASEVFLMDWIFNHIGSGDSLTTMDLEDHRKKNSMKFYKSQNKWNKLVKEDLKKRDYYSEKGKIFGGIIIFLSILSFAVGIISLVFSSLYGLIPLFLGIFTLIYGASLLYKTNDKGYIQYRLWQDFKNQLKNQRDKNIDIDDDKALIYAIALDLPMEDLDNYRTSVAHSYYPLGWDYLYFLTNEAGVSQFEDTFNNSFYGYNSTNTSSTGAGFGGGGGFTGGGGGGGAGGGALEVFKVYKSIKNA